MSKVVVKQGVAKVEVKQHRGPYRVVGRTPKQTGFGNVGEDLLPATDSAYDLGSEAKRWAEVHTDLLEIGGVETSAIREVLTANRTYYVRTDGSDSNDGLTNNSGGAFLTIGAAMSAIGALDIGNYDVTVQLASGTYTSSTTITRRWVGSGDVTISGDTTTPANVIISTSAACIYAIGFGVRIRVQGLKLVSSASHGLWAQNGALIEVTGKMEYGACSGYHLIAVNKGLIYNQGSDYTISGAAQIHIYASGQSLIYQNDFTVTVSGTPAFSSAFVYAVELSQIQATSITYSGSATGVYYYAGLNSVIQTGGGGATYFPGNSSGFTATGGQYA